jgi:hypothetical protein
VMGGASWQYDLDPPGYPSTGFGLDSPVGILCVVLGIAFLIFMLTIAYGPPSEWFKRGGGR